MTKKKLYICMIIIPIILLPTCVKKNDSFNRDLEQLRSLPYVSWTEEKADLSLSGVTKYDSSRTYPGYNLFFERNQKAVLMDMNGDIVHSWILPYIGMWEYSVLKENGNLIAECVDKCAMEVTWKGETVWVDNRKWHHDIELCEDGTYLMADKITVPYNYRKVNFDRIIRVTETGETTVEWSTWDNLAELQELHSRITLDNQPHETQLEEVAKDMSTYDYYHLNTIKVLPFTWQGIFDSRFRNGNLLVCLRNVNLILILDKDTKKVVWHWGPGDLEWPHMPVMLDNGEILIYDNGKKRKYTRIIQVNPGNNRITWEYTSDPRELFYSHLCGSAQRFPNGNTLIANSCNGHAFEITKKGEMIWEYYHPVINKGKRRTIYRMIKYPEEMVEKLLKDVISNGN